MENYLTKPVTDVVSKTHFTEIWLQTIRNENEIAY